jgi:AcrR family transcriptional regulator
MATNATTPAVPRRGDDTRERLLDAVEALISEHGYQALTHRLIAQRADVHVALLNYHFGSKDQLVEDALARRAGRLMQMQKEALDVVVANGSWTVEDVLWAVWQPFALVDTSSDPSWRHYLCAVARLASHDRGEALHARRFAPIAEAALDALQRALPALSRDELERGMRYARIILERELREACANGSGQPGQLRRRMEAMIAFVAGGFRALHTDVARTTG